MNRTEFSIFPKYTYYDIYGYLFSGTYFLFSSFFAYYVLYLKRAPQTFISTFLKSIKGFNLLSFLFILFLIYFIGQFLLTLSSFIIDEFYNKWTKIEKYLPKGVREVLKSRFFKLYHIHIHNIIESQNENGENNKKENDNFKKITRFIISYVDQRQPSTYSTAFVFLSFNEMALSVAITSFFYAILFLILGPYKYIVIYLSYLIIFVVFIYKFERFHKLFWQQIISGFLLREESLREKQ